MRKCFLVVALLYGASVFAIGKIGVALRKPDNNGITKVVISDVFPGSPADRAGLKVNDVILRFDGKTVGSNVDFMQAVRAIGDTIARPITVLRAGREFTVRIKVVQAKTYLIHVVREFNWLNFVATPFEVHVSNVHLGDVDEDESKDFYATTEFGDTASIYVKGTSPYTGETSMSYRYKIVITDGYMPVVTFKAEKTPVILHFSDKLIDPVTDHELAVYRAITSDSSAAPGWFKRTVRKTLQGFDEEWRGKFFSSLIQCPLVMRLLALLVVFITLFWLLQRKKISIILVGVAFLYPATWVINSLISLTGYGFGSNGHYIPFEFTFFCVLVLGMITYIGMILYPFAIRVDEHKEKIVVRWGILGKIFAVIEILFAFKEIYNLIAKIFEWPEIKI